MRKPKVQPHTEGPWKDEMEQAVLGCMMLHESATRWGIANLRPEVFFKPIHQTIFSAFVELAAEGFECDTVTAREQLERSGHWVGMEDFGDEYLIGLVTSTGCTGTGARQLARDMGTMLLRKYIRREVLRKGKILVHHADAETRSHEQFMDMVVGIQQGLLSIGTDTFTTEDFDPEEQTGVLGVSTGLRCLDRYVGDAVGFPRKDLSVVGAKRGAGKSAFMGNACILARKAGRKPAYATFEMSWDTTVNRFIQHESGWAYRPKVASFQREYDEAVQRVREWKIPIYDPTDRADADMTVERLCSWAETIHETKGLTELYVDYIQLVTAKGRFENHTHMMGHVSGELKRLAKRLDIPVIAGSQLSKGEDGEQKTKDAIRIEEDAAFILYLSKEKSQNKSFTPVGATIAVGKSRHGFTGTETGLEFCPRHVRYQDPNQEEEQPYDPFSEENLANEPRQAALMGADDGGK